MVPCTFYLQAGRRQSELSSLELRNSEALEQVRYSRKGGFFWSAFVGRPSPTVLNQADFLFSDPLPPAGTE